MPEKLTDEQWEKARVVLLANADHTINIDLPIDDRGLVGAWVTCGQLCATIDADREQIERLDKLLVCYRVGKRPSGKLLDELADYRGGRRGKKA